MANKEAKKEADPGQESFWAWIRGGKIRKIKGMGHEMDKSFVDIRAFNFSDAAPASDIFFNIFIPVNANSTRLRHVIRRYLFGLHFLAYYWSGV